MRIGLFFGSFNPIHVGHLIIANYFAEHTELDRVWLVVSPHNPLKKKSTLARDYDRLHLVELATADNDRLFPSKVEFDLPKPSYTIDTLTHLHERYPQHEFTLLMGGDSLASLPKWKNYERILERNTIFVYRRPGYELPEELTRHPSVQLFDAPLMQISASFVRECIREGKSVRYLLTEPVHAYLDSSHLYRS